jgi:hypothetical protein
MQVAAKPLVPPKLFQCFLLCLFEIFYLFCVFLFLLLVGVGVDLFFIYNILF